jgi:hypothetical protein
MEISNFGSQYGGAVLPEYTFYRSNLRRQKGYGLGGIFGTLARYAVPVAKFLWPHAKQAFQDIATDVVHQKVPLRQAVKARGIGALKAIGKNIITGQTGSGRRRRRRSAPKSKTTAKKKNIKKFQSSSQSQSNQSQDNNSSKTSKNSKAKKIQETSLS